MEAHIAFQRHVIELLEENGEYAAATAYAEAARRATNVGERDHLVRQAAGARAALTGRRHRQQHLDDRP